MKMYKLKFQGYWREPNKAGVPRESGVYLVYRAVYNKSSDTVGLKEIIYIGQSDNVNKRLNNHDKQEQFEGQLQQNEELCYAFAPVEKDELDIVENALIFMQKPVLNEDLKDSFNHPESSFTIDGRCAWLKSINFSIS